MAELSRPDLCVILDAVVASEPARRDLSGKIAVGVCDRSEQRWWNVDLANVGSACFSEVPDPSADCIWVLGEREARAVLSGKRLDARANSRVYGNRAVLETLRRHYLTTHNVLSLRASHA